ncbi:MAG: hypothetical protein IJ165_07205 [Proteobacteria bacterium]|nr:hypothetical protein [Pseudomonadota bacterium]
MKWMIDADFFNERIARRCTEPCMRRDSAGDRRLITMQFLLSNSVNGHAWQDAADLALRLGRPIKQCERVWQLCIEENVLRPVPGGYSAIEWMREKGYFNDDWKYRNQAPPRNGYPTRQQQGSYAPPKNDFKNL